MNGINALIAQGGWKEPKFDIMETARNALLMKRAKQEIETFPEERDWEREKRGMVKSKFAQEEEDLPFKREEEALQHIAQWGHLVTYQNYPDSRARWIRRGINQDLLPPREYFDDLSKKITGGEPDKEIASQLFDRWRDVRLQSVAQRLKAGEMELREREVKVKEAEIPIREREVTAKEKAVQEPKDEFERMLKRYKESKDPSEKEFYLARLKKLSESTGFTIEVDKDGNVKVVQGPIGAMGGMTKTTQTRLEEKLLNTADQLSRLAEIEKSYKAEYQKIPFRAQQSWASLREKTGADLTPEEKTNLSNFSMFRRQAISNINLYIKEITGAQMSELESKRLRQAMPDPGEGIFGGDSPTVFEAKMKDTIYQLRLASIRYAYLKKHGLGIEAIPLGSMESIVNKRGDDIADELSKRGMKGSELEKAVSNQIISEFGMMP